MKKNNMRNLGVGAMIGLAGLVGCTSTIVDHSKMLKERISGENYSPSKTGERIIVANSYHGDLNGNGLDSRDFKNPGNIFFADESINVYFPSGRENLYLEMDQKTTPLNRVGIVNYTQIKTESRGWISLRVVDDKGEIFDSARILIK